MKRFIFGVALFLLLLCTYAFAGEPSPEQLELDPVVKIVIRIAVGFVILLTIGTAIAAEVVTDKHKHQ